MKRIDIEMLTIAITGVIMLMDVLLTAFAQQQLDVIILIGVVIILISVLSLRKAIKQAEALNERQNNQPSNQTGYPANPGNQQWPPGR